MPEASLKALTTTLTHWGVNYHPSSVSGVLSMRPTAEAQVAEGLAIEKLAAEYALRSTIESAILPTMKTKSCGF